MRSPTHIPLTALLAAAIVIVVAPASAAQAAFGVEEKNFEAGTCTVASCTYASVEADHADAYTQAAGHPQFGLTTFVFNHKKGLLGEEPEGAVKNIRVDVPPGLAANPEALPKCSIAEFAKDECPAETQVGVNDLTVLAKALGANVEVEAKVYNLEPEGMPLEFGIHAEALAGAINEHVYLKGHVSWHSESKLQEEGIASGDYHEYFEIDGVSEENPVLKSKLIFKGRIPGLKPPYTGEFLTVPSVCSSSTISHLEVESWSGEVSRTKTVTPVGVDGCDGVPFSSSVALTAGVAQSDEPDGSTVEVKVPQDGGQGEVGSSDVAGAHVTLPEGMTLDPSAARGLETCSSAEIAIGTANPVSCPAGSKVGEVTIETPDLPAGSLLGSVYLGSPTGAVITGPPFTVYVAAESSAYDVSVRLRGLVTPNANTGRLEASFTETPELPFSDVVVKLKGGPQAPLANPLACEAGQIESLLEPYSGQAPAFSSDPFASAGCASPLPFALTQGTQAEPATAGAHTSYTFALARAAGQQYLSQVTTTLPAGLVGVIPSVTLCGEAQAATGTCGAASQIGAATVSAGSGSEPFSFSGPVYLTGPYNGAPYGLSIAVPAVAGPFDFGTIVTRATINVEPTTARVIVTATLPRIVDGVPIRLRAVRLAIDRPNFLLDPTNCGSLTTDSVLTSTTAATQSLSTPFAVGGCGALAFAPAFAAQTNGKTSKVTGASLLSTVTQAPGQANIHSVSVQLPAQLVTRLSALQQACPEATYAAAPSSCPAGSNVGTAAAATPVLPLPLTGPAYLVSHGGAAFPNLDLLLQANGVRVILEGSTNIAHGVTSETFASLPDVPISSFELSLPSGPHSLLAANASLCPGPLVMPTTIVAQNGARIAENTKMAVAGCGASRLRGVRILKRRVAHRTLILTVQTFAAGRIRCSGANLKTVSRRMRRASRTVIKIPLSRAGLAVLRRRHRLRARVRVSFVPAQKGAPRSSAAATLRLR